MINKNHPQSININNQKLKNIKNNIQIYPLIFQARGFDPLLKFTA
jgi:hypothetical protein